jgi:hypothetical protein
VAVRRQQQHQQQPQQRDIHDALADNDSQLLQALQVRSARRCDWPSRQPFCLLKWRVNDSHTHNVHAHVIIHFVCRVVAVCLRCICGQCLRPR